MAAQDHTLDKRIAKRASEIYKRRIRKGPWMMAPGRAGHPGTKENMEP